MILKYESGILFFSLIVAYYSSAVITYLAIYNY